FLIVGATDQTSHLSTEADSKVCGVRCLNDLLVRVSPEEIGGQEDGGKFRLGVPGGPVDDDALLLDGDDIIEQLRDYLVVAALDEGWPHALHEREEPRPCPGDVARFF